MAPFAALGAGALGVMLALQAGAAPQVPAAPVPTVEQIEAAVARADAQAAAVNGRSR